LFAWAKAFEMALVEPNNEIIVPELNKDTIESMIYVVRGEKVMLVFELLKYMVIRQKI
jgi:hypothetical protein